MEQLIVGIAGGTSAGKSSLCTALEKELTSKAVTVIHLDWYFFPEAKTNNRPEAIDINQCLTDLASLRQGKTVTRTSRSNTHVIEPRPVIIIEGHLALTFPELVEQFDLTIFVDMDVEERVLRRIERNVGAGMELSNVISWYRKDVRENHWEFIEPTKRQADLIVWGEITPRRVRVLADILRSRLPKDFPTDD